MTQNGNADAMVADRYILTDVHLDTVQFVVVLAAVDWKGTEEVVKTRVDLWEVCDSSISLLSFQCLDFIIDLSGDGCRNLNYRYHANHPYFTARRA